MKLLRKQALKKATDRKMNNSMDIEIYSCTSIDMFIPKKLCDNWRKAKQELVLDYLLCEDEFI